MRVGVVVAAGGRGRRMGGVAKPLLELAGEPILRRALAPFLAQSTVTAVVVALPEPLAAEPPSWLVRLDARITFVTGGEERGESVARALAALPSDVDVIAVHDAARPLVSAEVVQRALAAAGEGRSVVVAVPVSDTIQEVDASGTIVATPERHRLWAAQTPQVFPAAVLRDAYRRAREEHVVATDDAALVARYGGRVEVLEGERSNLKITTDADLRIARALLDA